MVELNESYFVDKNLIILFLFLIITGLIHYLQAILNSFLKSGFEVLPVRSCAYFNRCSVFIPILSRSFIHTENLISSTSNYICTRTPAIFPADTKSPNPALEKHYSRVDLSFSYVPYRCYKLIVLWGVAIRLCGKLLANRSLLPRIWV